MSARARYVLDAAAHFASFHRLCRGRDAYRCQGRDDPSPCRYRHGDSISSHRPPGPVRCWRRISPMSPTPMYAPRSPMPASRVASVEHIMAALAVCGIDNALVELSGPEVPALDGSAQPFVFLIECAGTAVQEVIRPVISVLRTGRSDRRPGNLPPWFRRIAVRFIVASSMRAPRSASRRSRYPFIPTRHAASSSPHGSSTTRASFAPGANAVSLAGSRATMRSSSPMIPPGSTKRAFASPTKRFATLRSTPSATWHWRAVWSVRGSWAFGLVIG